jgi:prevent-host-death family protein
LHDVTGTTVQVLAIVTKLEADSWLAQFAKSGVKKVPLSEINDDLSRYLREAETQEIVITRHGKPAGVLIGFESEEDWFEYRLENDPRFLRRIEQARNSLHVGRGLRQEDVETE